MKQDSKQPSPLPHPLLAKSTYTWFKLENWRVTIFFTLEEENLSLPKCAFILKTIKFISFLLKLCKPKHVKWKTTQDFSFPWLRGKGEHGRPLPTWSTHMGLMWPTCSKNKEFYKNIHSFVSSWKSDVENVALPSQMITNAAASFRLGLPIQRVPVSTTPHIITAKSPAGIQVLPALVRTGL